MQSMSDGRASASAEAPERPVGVVLAGGESRRLGRDKALLELDGRGLASRAADLLAAVCREVVVADGGRGVVAGLLSVADGPGAGPAAGILGAAQRFPDRALLVLACDLPRVPATLLERLVASSADWVLPRHGGRLEPLCALYRPAALAALARQVERGQLAVHRLAASCVAVAYVDLAANDDELFLNVNSPADLARLAALGASLRQGDG